MTVTARTPKRADLYVRLSDLRTEDLNELGQAESLADQERRLRAHAERLGWGVRRVVVENDMTPDGKPKPASAFKRRKVRVPGYEQPQLRTVRPKFRAILEDLSGGRCDGLLALDLDRAVRDPRDLEDLIDTVEQFEVPVESVTGSLRLASDADITMARVMVAVANKESRDKARRVSASRERRALNGQFGGGKRPYGFEPDGIARREDECAVIADCAYKVVQGVSLRALARDLRDRKVPTVTGRQWSAETLKDILIRERNAGRMVWRGEVVGRAPWEPIVPADVHDAVVSRLTDPERRLGPGPAPKWLGSGIYLCGVCGDGTTCNVLIAGRAPRYRCKSRNHLARNCKHVDDHVAAFVIEYLARADVVDLVTPGRPEVDVAGLRAERQAISDRLRTIGGDVALGDLTREAGIEATRRGKARIEEIDRMLAEAVSDDPLAPWVAAEDPAKVWEEATLEERRQLVKRLVRVTILPTGRRGSGFDRSAVLVEPAL